MADILHIEADLASLARGVGRALAGELERLTQDMRSSIDEGGAGAPIEVAVSGGFVATQVLPIVAASPQARTIDWSLVRVWWVDERFVGADDTDRNDVAARGALFDSTAGVDLRPMPADRGQGVEAARAEYLNEWNAQMRGRSLDLVILGVGEDGHIASLFPRHETLDMTQAVLAEPDSPKPPPPRLTLSAPVLLEARSVWVVAGGSGKAQALRRAFAGEDPREVPVAMLRTPRTTWWLDRAAAQYLPVEP